MSNFQWHAFEPETIGLSKRERIEDVLSKIRLNLLASVPFHPKVSQNLISLVSVFS